MVLVPGSEEPGFSYLEYQAFMLGLAGLIISGVSVVELAMRRFQVLPILFPGVFTVTCRRLYFFSFDISDGQVGKRIRSEAKMLIRVTLCVVLSYLWQKCVVETSQQIGREFPHELCQADSHCFKSKLSPGTLFTRQVESLDCSGPSGDFETSAVVSCIRLIQPSATTWLMHLAIAHSVTQLNFKAYEVLVWIAGNSRWVRYVIGFLVFVSLSIFMALFVGVVSEFVSSWLSFVMSVTIPIFLYTVWSSAKALETLWKEDNARVHVSIENNLNSAFEDIEQAIAQEASANQEMLRNSTGVDCIETRHVYGSRGKASAAGGMIKNFLVAGFSKSSDVIHTVSRGRKQFMRQRASGKDDDADMLEEEPTPVEPTKCSNPVPRLPIDVGPFSEAQPCPEPSRKAVL